ncbi:hypothetical protein EYB35_05925 [Bacillus paranthracis]|nr:hypothetical protein EYB35_05925 [Bacillus paranthracis]
MEKYLFYIKEKMAILYKEPMLACNKYRFFYVLNKGCYNMCISQLFFLDDYVNFFVYSNNHKEIYNVYSFL